MAIVHLFVNTDTYFDSGTTFNDTVQYVCCVTYFTVTYDTLRDYYVILTFRHTYSTLLYVTLTYVTLREAGKYQDVTNATLRYDTLHYVTYPNYFTLRYVRYVTAHYVTLR